MTAIDGGGPTPAELGITPPPIQEKKGFLGFGRKKSAAPPAERQAPPPTKEALPGKMGKVMAELKKKDGELEGRLISEFGEGEAKFVILKRHLSLDGTRYKNPNPLTGNEAKRDGSDDYLLVTADGFKILRVKTGEHLTKEEYEKRHAGSALLFDLSAITDANGIISDSRNQDTAFRRVVQVFLHRGSADYIARHEGSTEGAGYTHGKPGHGPILNFGKDAYLNFEHPYGDQQHARIEYPSATDTQRLIREVFSDTISDSEKKGMRDLSSDAATLILNPDSTEIAEIMQLNIEEAKKAVDSVKAAKLAKEAEKLAEAEAARKPETDKLVAEEAKKTEAARNTVAQAQTADSVLDLLGKS